MGILQQTPETNLIQHSQDEADLQVRVRHPDPIPPRRYDSMDAAIVRIQPRSKSDKSPKEPEDRQKQVPPAQQSRRHRQKEVREQPAVQPMNLKHFCDIRKTNAFEKPLWASSVHMKAALTPELSFLKDGAIWVWKSVSHYCPNAVQIVDGYLAQEHLERLAAVAFPDPQARSSWLEEAGQDL